MKKTMLWEGKKKRCRTSSILHCRHVFFISVLRSSCSFFLRSFVRLFVCLFVCLFLLVLVVDLVPFLSARARALSLPPPFQSFQWTQLWDKSLSQNQELMIPKDSPSMLLTSRMYPLPPPLPPSSFNSTYSVSLSLSLCLSLSLSLSVSLCLFVSLCLCVSSLRPQK